MVHGAKVGDKFAKIKNAKLKMQNKRTHGRLGYLFTFLILLF
jgi:hypothetical protein